MRPSDENAVPRRSILELFHTYLGLLPLVVCRSNDLAGRLSHDPRKLGR